MANKQKILQIYELLEECPKTRAILPCKPEDFKKIIFLYNDKALEKLYAALILEKSKNA